MEKHDLRGRYGPHEVFYAVVQDGFFLHENERGKPVNERSRMRLFLMDPSGAPIDAKLNVKILERKPSEGSISEAFSLVDLDRNELWDAGIVEHRPNGEVKLWIGIPTANFPSLFESRHP